MSTLTPDLEDDFDFDFDDDDGIFSCRRAPVTCIIVPLDGMFED